MKTKLVLWATNQKDEKTLLAYQLQAEDNIVMLWSFSGENATNDVHRALMYEWREGKETAFPSAGYEEHKLELSVSNSLLPEGFKTEKEELITRAQTEWHFVVLSAKLNHSYLSELEDLELKVTETEAFQPGLWEELVGFWDKVQSQVRERNLSKEKKLDEEFKEQAKGVYDKFIGIIDNLDKKVSSGGNLAALFNELKDIQNECRDAKLTRDLRSKLWERIDSSFKVVKEKRFGPEGATNSPLERIERRYDGLIKAIKRMEHSIQRDEKDLNYQNSKMNSFDAGQLETQLREAKIKVIQVQVDSKKEKLADMHKTREELEKKIEKERAKSQKIKEAKEKEAAKKSEDSAKGEKSTETKKEEPATSKKDAKPEAKAAEEKPAEKAKAEQAKPEQPEAKPAKEAKAKEEAKPEAKQPEPEQPKAKADPEPAKPAKEVKAEAEKPEAKAEPTEPKPVKEAKAKEETKPEAKQPEPEQPKAKAAEPETAKPVKEEVKAEAKQPEPEQSKDTQAESEEIKVED